MCVMSSFTLILNLQLVVQSGLIFCEFFLHLGFIILVSELRDDDQRSFGDDQRRPSYPLSTFSSIVYWTGIREMESSDEDGFQVPGVMGPCEEGAE